MYEFKDQLEAGEVEVLDKLYKSGKSVSVYQHPLFNDPLQSNQRTMFFLQRENEEIVLSAKVIESHLTKAPFVKYAHVRGGFLYKNKAMVFPAIKELLNHYKQQKFAKLTVELFCDFQEAEFTERSLRKDGISFDHDFLSGARATLLLSLKDDTETIHSRFTGDLKRNLVKAQKKGARIVDVKSAAEFEKFITVYQKMETARGIKLGSSNYLKTLFDFITATGLGYFLACYNTTDTLIGGILLFKEGKQVEYIVGASDPDYKGIPQLHLALYEGIKLAQKDGFELFDFGGYGFNEKEGSQVFGINQFKLNFTDNIVFYPKNIVFKTNTWNNFIGSTFIKLKNRMG